MQAVKSKLATMLNMVMPRRNVLQNTAAAVASGAVLSWLRLCPLGILFLALFFFWLYNTCCNFRIVPPPELEQNYEIFLERMQDWCKNRPIMARAVASAFFISLAIVGFVISGYSIGVFGLALATILFSKYPFKFVVKEEEPNNPKDSIEIDDEVQFEVHEKTLQILQAASDATSHTSPTDVEDEDESDDIPSELLIDSDSMPEIDEYSTDDEDELLSAVQPEPQSIQPPPSESANREALQFKKGYFKYDSSLSTSSSSSEECLSKGLKFPDHTTVDAATRKQQLAARRAHDNEASAAALKSATNALLDGGGTLLPNLLTGWLQWGMNNANSNMSGIVAHQEPIQQLVIMELDSSDASDFEIVEVEEFK